jgi:hypothetical protein
MQAFTTARRFFDALAHSRGDVADSRIGPRLPTLFADAGIEPLEVELFPVSISRLGPADGATWTARQEAIETQLAGTTDPAVRSAGDDFLRALADYQGAAASAGAGFVEIQSTLLISVVGEREAE